MSNPWDKFTENEDLKADLVGGQLIGFVNGAHTVLGHVNDGELFLTDAGKEVKDVLDAAEKPRRGRRASAETAPEAGLSLDVTDTVTTEDQVG